MRVLVIRHKIFSRRPTEVVSENSKTYRTAKNIENELGGGILALLETLRAWCLFTAEPTTTDEYSIKFNDNIIQDRDSEANLGEYYRAPCHC